MFLATLLLTKKTLARATFIKIFIQKPNVFVAKGKNQLR
jgi:hypothetical protein